jgi:hypothetical protein
MDIWIRSLHVDLFDNSNMLAAISIKELIAAMDTTLAHGSE